MWRLLAEGVAAINNQKAPHPEIMLQLYRGQSETGKLAGTMCPLSGSNEKAWTDGDTTGSVPRATREAPLSGLGLLQALAPPPMQKK